MPEPAPYTPIYQPLFTEAQLKAAMVAAYEEGIEDASNAMWSRFKEGPEAIQDALDKLKDQTP
jgi:hypothetical protein